MDLPQTLRLILLTRSTHPIGPEYCHLLCAYLFMFVFVSVPVLRSITHRCRMDLFLARICGSHGITSACVVAVLLSLCVRPVWGVCFGMCNHAGGWPGSGRTFSTVPNLWSCSQSHLLAVLCVCLSLTISLWNKAFFPLFVLLLLYRIASQMASPVAAALSLSALSTWYPYVKLFCLYFSVSCDLSLLFPCR